MMDKHTGKHARDRFMRKALEIERRMEEAGLCSGGLFDCVAGDTLVLTPNGAKPIVEITLTDRVWDGESWVAHDGVIRKGVRDTISFGGIGITPDHEILTADGWRRAEATDFESAARYASDKHPGVQTVCGTNNAGGEQAVYDILNAGPNHRFAVICKMREVVIISNCDCACAAAPDYSGVAAASDKAAEYAYKAASDDLSFRKNVYNDSKPQQRVLADLAQRIAQQQLGSAEKSAALADENTGYWRGTYQPMERQTVMDAMGSRYLGADDRAKLAAVVSGTSGLTGDALTAETDRLATAGQEGAATRAVTDTNATINRSVAQQGRELRRFGGDPNKMASYASDMAVGSTAIKVGAANTAREGAADKLKALRTGVANFGRNMPNTAGQSVALSTSAGNAAVGNQNAALMSGLPYAQFASGGTQSALSAAQLQQQGALGLGGLMSRDYSTSVQDYANQSGGDGGLGGMLGLAGSLITSFSSDRRLKENIEAVGQDEDNGLTLYEFNYIGETQRYRGVMADEVQRVMPRAVSLDADGYAMVDYGMLGIEMVEV